MSNTVTTLFPDEPQAQSQNCYVDFSNPWNYWRPFTHPSLVWITGGAPTPAPIADEPEEDDEEPEEDEEDECLTLTMNDVEAMLRRVIKEELGSLRIVQGKE